MLIVIDSTEFRQDRGLNKEDLSLIKDLGKKKLIDLHIPWFVYKESTSTSIDELEKDLNRIQNSLINLQKKGMHIMDAIKARKLAKEVEGLYNNARKSNEKLWDRFIKSANATLHKFDEKDSIAVFDSYFNGGKPFKSLKSRDDIPDAFIYATIKKLSERKKVYLISGDNNLREKCEGESDIVVYKDFQQFYLSDDYLKIKSKYEKLLESEKIENAKELLLENRDNIQDAVLRYTSRVDIIELDETPLLSDNGEATIRAIDDPKVTIDEAGIKFIDNQFFVPITVEATASIDYFIYKSDYYSRMNFLPRYSEDWNDHYFLMEDVVPVTLTKTLIISIDEIKEDEDLDIEIGEFDEIVINIKSENDEFYEDLNF